jgi:uncharacterized membrane protein YfcA
VLVLALLFFATALLYSAVGFGGGSTYNALLVLARTDYRAVPAVALTCNILVVIIGSRRFATAGYVQWRRIWPLFTLSVPMAWVGGRIMVSEALFVGLLAASLFVAGVTMLWRSEPEDLPVAATRATWAEPLIGGGLGFLAGIVGIGGGIFLAPILHLLRWGRSKAIAATCSVFILVNSIPGLVGQLSKSDGYDRVHAIGAHWLLFPAVVVGGLVGSTLGSRQLAARYVRIATALLVLYVAVELGVRFYSLVSGPAA